MTRCVLSSSESPFSKQKLYFDNHCFEEKKIKFKLTSSPLESRSGSMWLKTNTENALHYLPVGTYLCQCSIQQRTMMIYATIVSISWQILYLTLNEISDGIAKKTRLQINKCCPFLLRLQLTQRSVVLQGSTPCFFYSGKFLKIYFLQA